MAESAHQTAHQRRASWVGLRTLRQRPRLVDETASGAPIYEVRSVRLVLLGSSSHFSRLVHCSKCGAEVPGGPVLTTADLDRPSHSVICKDCVRSTGVASQRQPRGPLASDDRPAPPPAAPTKEPEPPEPTPRPELQKGPPDPVATAPATDDGRLAAIEEQLQTALLRVGELTDLQRVESSTRSEADEAMQARMQSAMLQSLAQLRAEVMASAEAGATRMAALEESLRRSVADVADALQSRKDELTGLASSLVEVRSEVERVTQVTQEVASAQADLERRVGELAAGTSGQVTAGALDEAEQRIVEGLHQARAHMTSLEERLEGDVTSVTGMVESQRAEMDVALDGRMREELSTVATVVDEMGLAQAQLARKVDELVQQVSATNVRVDTLASSARAFTTRVQGLEQGVADSRHRLTEDVAGPHGEASAPPARAGDAASSVDLLDALERQLQEAESRLARLGDVG